MIVYLAGRITGDPAYRAKFADAEMVLRELGHTVLNPAVLPDGLEYAAYMAIDEQMLRAADAVCLLPDWRQSEGATIEYLIARQRRIRIFLAETFDAHVALELNMILNHETEA